MAKLNARVREGTGKGVARKLRAAGEIPAVAYGHGKEARSLAVNAHELELLLASINPENTIIDLRIQGSTATPALIREVQQHPSRPVILHVDFFQVQAGEKIHVEIPVRVLGSPVGVRESGGVLQESMHTLSIECLPKDIPNAIEVDVENLQVGDSVSVSELTVENVTILNDPDLVICSVTTPTVVGLPEDAVAEEGIGEVEPELIRDRKEEAEGVPSERGSAHRE